jgi:hypothetical protein
VLGGCRPSGGCYRGDVAPAQIVLQLAHLGGELAFPGLEALLEVGDEAFPLLQLREPEVRLGLELGLADIECALALVEPSRALRCLLVARLPTPLELFDPAPLRREQLFQLLDPRLALRKLRGALMDGLHELLDAERELVVLRFKQWVGS